MLVCGLIFIKRKKSNSDINMCIKCYNIKNAFGRKAPRQQFFFSFFSTSLDLTREETLLSCTIGLAPVVIYRGFVDQMPVQRFLAAKSLTNAKRLRANKMPYYDFTYVH